ncbi:UDP pyrophosphate phosphatase [Streptomyces sp. F63]|nr:UDP pyrophosphate phosphatase [Streptomyces sp. F63]
MNWFMKFITTRSFMPFVIYRIALGAVLFALIATGALDPLAGESAG